MKINGRVSAGGEAVVAVPVEAVLTSNEAIESKGVRVTAFNPVSVHAVVESQYSSGGYLALPTAALGTEYFVISRADSSFSGSAVVIVGTRAGTAVTITPAAAGATRPANTPFQIMLNAGETYQLANPSNADTTGSRIVASAPVAVFGGHPCANVPQGVSACDNLIEQMADVTRAAGTALGVMPFTGKQRYTLRLLGVADGIFITYNPAVPGGCAMLNAGQFCEFIATGSQQILSSAPMLVAQFMHGAQDEPEGMETGDPSMVIVVPEERGLRHALVSVHGLEGATGGYVNIVTPTAAIGGLRIDGNPVDAGAVSVIGGSSHSGAAIALTAGVHRIEGSAPFTATVYGIAQYSSYAYPAGSGF